VLAGVPIRVPEPVSLVVKVDEPVKLTTALALPATADTDMGAVNTAAGAAGDKLPTVELAALEPTLLLAVTANEYAVPFVNPFTVIGEAAPVAVSPPGLAVTV
jgi:hypothetical protein